jgi:hypothetical protein
MVSSMKSDIYDVRKKTLLVGKKFVQEKVFVGSSRLVDKDSVT